MIRNLGKGKYGQVYLAKYFIFNIDKRRVDIFAP